MWAPHVGASWRTQEVACLLLNLKMITWDDFLYGVDCTDRLPPGYLADALNQLDERPCARKRGWA